MIAKLKLSFTVVLYVLLLGCGGDKEVFPVLPPAKEIDSPARQNSSLPNLVTDPVGTLLLNWTETADGQSTLYYSSLKQGAWSDPAAIASGPNWFVNWADVSGIAADGNGNMIASFLVKSGTKTYGYDLNLVVSNDLGETWLGPFVPHDDRTQTEHGFVTLLPIDTNQFFIAWLDGRNNVWGSRESGGSMSLRGAFVDNNAAITYEGPIDLRVCDCCQPSAVKTAIGPAVVYRDRSGDEIRDISIVWWDNGKWTGPFPVSRDNWQIDGCPVDGPTADALGNVLAVVWFTASQSVPRVNVAFSSDSGKTFGKPIRVDDGHAVGRADIVLLDQDTAVVSWLESLEDHGEIRTKKVFKNGTMEPSHGVSEMSLSRSSGFPQMSALDGNIYIAWTEKNRIRTAYIEP